MDWPHHHAWIIKTCIAASSVFLLGLAGTCCCECGHAAPFYFQAVDAQTSRGVPMVSFQALTGQRWYSDSAGIAVIDDPIVNGKTVFFKPESDGYHFDAPGLAMGGVTVDVAAGSSCTVVLQRENIAERLYRITGPGIYRDSAELGLPVPIAHPMSNQNVTGQDSVLTSVYHGRDFWIWGDTGRLNHPLGGNFRSTGGWSDLPGSGGLDPATGINIDYIPLGDYVQPMVPKSGDGKSETYWISALMALPDSGGREHLLADYSRIAMPGMRTIEHGKLEFNDGENYFDFLQKDVRDTSTGLERLGGHARMLYDGKTTWSYVVASSSLERFPANYESALKPADYFGLTCLKQGEMVSTSSSEIDRLPDGRVRYSWKKNTSCVDYAAQEALIKSGVLRPDERRFYPVDVDSGRPVLPHGSSLAWNPLRNRWVMIFSEMMGSSMLGEQWFMEADAPEGPWIYARKVVTHNNYSFYNPLLHPELNADPTNPYLYFEATYTATFSGNTHPTPLYDYNQIMYRLNLADQRLSLPVPVYRGRDGRLFTWNGKLQHQPDSRLIAFFAPASPAANSVGITESRRAGTGKPHWALAAIATRSDPGSKSSPVFYALPLTSCGTSFTQVLLKDGSLAELNSAQSTSEGIGLVWKNLSSHAIISRE